MFKLHFNVLKLVLTLQPSLSLCLMLPVWLPWRRSTSGAINTENDSFLMTAAGETAQISSQSLCNFILLVAAACLALVETC